MTDPLARAANARRERRIVSVEAVAAAIASGAFLGLGDGPLPVAASIFLGVVALAFVWLRHGWFRSEADWVSMHEYDVRLARGDYS